MEKQKELTCACERVRDAREGKFTFSGEFRRITPNFLSVVSFFFRRGRAVSFCYVFFCRQSLK